MKKYLLIVSSLIVTLILSGCAKPQIPEPEVFNDGLVYYPDWNGYDNCYPRSQGYADCFKGSDKKGPIIKTLQADYLATYRKWLQLYPLKSKNDINSFCYKSKNQLARGESECKETLTSLYVSQNRLQEAKNLGLMDNNEYRERLLDQGRYQEAYEQNLINKAEHTQWHKKKLLDEGNIIQAYELGYIDKHTADLYLQKQIIEQQNEQARQQQAYQKRQTEATESAANTAAMNSFNQSMNNLSNQMRQNAYDTQQFSNQMEQSNYQLQQQRQNRKTNYQLRQINNNLNGIRYGY